MLILRPEIWLRSRISLNDLVTRPSNLVKTAMTGTRADGYNAPDSLVSNSPPFSIPYSLKKVSSAERNGRSVSVGRQYLGGNGVS